MNRQPAREEPDDRMAEKAAGWVLRSDRGLTPAEQDEFSEWLAADPRHGAQLARHRRHWNRLDNLGRWLPEHSTQPNPDLLAPPLRRQWPWRTPAMLSLAAAAAITFALIVRHHADVSPAPVNSPTAAATTSKELPGPRLLEDGTIVELNRGAALSVQFTATERRVRLERGEAHFAVTKDPARPFIVNAGGIDVRAVGTAFNVRVEAAAVEVLVTEGRVQLNSPPETTSLGHTPAVTTPALVPLLEARQRAVVSLADNAPPPQIATLTPGEIERVLAWQHRLLDFTAAPLNEIVAEFNRRNVVQLVLIDSELASVRISAAFRSDNIEGFVHLLEAGFGVRTERRSDTEILLRKSR